jgi:glucokinase
MKALALDLGGSHAACGVVEDHRLVDCATFDTANACSLRAVLPRIAATFARLADGARWKDAGYSGLAVGLAALVDARTGSVLGTNGKYDDASQIDLHAWSRETFGLPLALENDARMALLGESYAGAAKGFRDVVMITLGTGIGGVAMIEGKLLRGAHSQAGCLGGHFPVILNGRPCNCGALGCAEAEASGWSLPQIVREWPGIAGSTLSRHNSVGFQQLFAEATAGDHIAMAIRDRCLAIWATLAVALVHAYDPELIILGGGVMQSAAAISPFIETYVQSHSWTPWGKVRVRAAELGNNAALLGAVPVLMANSRIADHLFIQRGDSSVTQDE